MTASASSTARNHRVAVVELPIEGKGNDAKSYAALKNIREDLVPATVGKLKGAEVVVGGNAASRRTTTISSRAPPRSCSRSS